MDEVLPDGWNPYSPENRTLKVCLGLLAQGEKPILISRAAVTRIKAQMIQVSAEDFSADQVTREAAQYTGRCHAYIPEERIEPFKTEGIDCAALYHMDGGAAPPAPVQNQFFILHSDQSVGRTVLGRCVGARVVPLRYLSAQPYGIVARNVGQRFMQEALLLGAEQAPLVIIKGPAGTAKTFFALAAGLHQVIEPTDKLYRRILISRPNVQFDQDIGFLPGDEKEKIAPYLRPIIDNLEILADRDEKARYDDERELRGKIDEFFTRNLIVAEAMNYIRGRSLTKTYLMIDEAQNLTPRQVKGIITRVGQGTKVVLLGDPQQIDHPLLDERTNGLSYAAEKMKGSPLCVQLTMESGECERSALALAAAERM